MILACFVFRIDECNDKICETAKESRHFQRVGAGVGQTRSERQRRQTRTVRG